MHQTSKTQEVGSQLILDMNKYPDLTATEEAMAKIFDDIDTAFDVYNPEMTLFQKYIHNKVLEAKKYFISDGYILKKRI